MISLFDLRRAAPRPWGRGAGLSTELMVYPPPPAEPAWRLSLATIEANGPYSAFPEFERVQLLLSGPGFALSGLETRLGFEQRGAKHRFAGELGLQVIEWTGPCRVFNAFARRGQWDADLWLRPLVGSMFLFPDPGTAWAIWVESGRAELRQGGQRAQLTPEAIALVGADRDGRVAIEGSGELVLARLRRLSPRDPSPAR